MVGPCDNDGDFAKNFIYFVNPCTVIRGENALATDTAKLIYKFV